MTYIMYFCYYNYHISVTLFKRQAPCISTAPLELQSSRQLSQFQPQPEQALVLRVVVMELQQLLTQKQMKQINEK